MQKNIKRKKLFITVVTNSSLTKCPESFIFKKKKALNKEYLKKYLLSFSAYSQINPASLLVVHEIPLFALLALHYMKLPQEQQVLFYWMSLAVDWCAGNIVTQAHAVGHRLQALLRHQRKRATPLCKRCRQQTQSWRDGKQRHLLLSFTGPEFRSQHPHHMAPKHHNSSSLFWPLWAQKYTQQTHTERHKYI